MRQLLRLATVTLVLLLAAAPAHAGLLAIDFQGVTFEHFEGTPAGPPIANGTSFNVQADFDTTTGTTLDPGVVSYAVTSVVLTGGGMSYTVTDPSDYSLTLVDATNTVVPGFYLPILDNNSGDTQLDELSPAYTTATPAFSAADPTPTVFSGFTGSQSFGNVLDFSTAAGPITLEFFLDVGVGASINAVPEPSSWVMGAAGFLGLIAYRRRRTKNERLIIAV
jgi:MYXO-CTERM domain-containing protein